MQPRTMDMFQIIASASDFDWSHTTCLAVFEDEAVAQLVCEALEGLTPGQRRQRGIYVESTFRVAPVKVIRAHSESRIPGLVNGLLDEHFPRTDRPR